MLTPAATQYGWPRAAWRKGSVSKRLVVLWESDVNRVDHTTEVVGGLQNWVKDHVGEKHDTLNKNEANTDRKRAAFILSLAEEIVMQDAALCKFPLVNAEGDE